MADDSRPALSFSSMVPGRAFGPSSYVVSDDLVDTYMDVTGDRNSLYTDEAAAKVAGLVAPVMPPGLTAVWARLSYLGEHRMLPGGVMAGQDIDLFRPVPVGATLTLRAEVVSAESDDPKRRVLLRCSAEDEAGHLIGQVRIDARWPEGEV